MAPCPVQAGTARILPDASDTYARVRSTGEPACRTAPRSAVAFTSTDTRRGREKSITIRSPSIVGVPRGPFPHPLSYSSPRSAAHSSAPVAASRQWRWPVAPRL